VSRRALIGVIAAAITALVVSIVEGRPARLPGVALGSPILLHAERALALLAVTAAAASIVVQAARGRLPIELSTSGLRYEAEAADNTAAAMAELQEQFDELVEIVGALTEQLDARG
jgi:hypothetical protein